MCESYSNLAVQNRIFAFANACIACRLSRVFSQWFLENVTPTFSGNNKTWINKKIIAIIWAIEMQIEFASSTYMLIVGIEFALFCCSLPLSPDQIILI